MPVSMPGSRAKTHKTHHQTQWRAIALMLGCGGLWATLQSLPTTAQTVETVAETVAQIVPLPPPVAPSPSENPSSQEELLRTSPNPLEMTEPDPLLPRPVVDRPLSPLEIYFLRLGVEDLQRQAEARYALGQTNAAFEIWYRELRLRRVLGLSEEVSALGRVGEVAWRENRRTDTRIVTARLEQIEQEQQAIAPPDYSLLLSIAQGYEKMRALPLAVALYDQLLTQARAERNSAVEQLVLTSLGQLHLAWFDYDKAAIAYTDLLNLARSRSDGIRELEYLQQLAYIYQQGKMPDRAIPIQQELVQRYEALPLPLLIPPLKIALGDNYRAIGRAGLAATTYQEAFTQAQAQQQYGYSSEALVHLAALYEGLNRPADTLLVYQTLIQVEQQSYNTYGIMTAYEKIAQLHQAQGETAEAIAAYQSALSLAQQLDYASRVSAYTAQIQTLSGS
ncbi:lipopolysaccharide assembly protein LapB [Thermoleptolyngbya sp. M55_K2018_002]|uniref:tetratricopeptide repeat protein n=1 Tax=Thermoleptolyngbya sp. M55_K2018_002 TaxID=2747808 RepID=UPI0019E9FBA0|nr:tetratricopeptide repeat protein [Thermoleptolyngbya sp. M55_K2018_002]HIK42016.1 tetratricopeptide repeat protein [Thermoleptolyngbya sp. M55_K2018_002]